MTLDGLDHLKKYHELLGAITPALIPATDQQNIPSGNLT
jgi:hypothetical protein